MQVSPTKLKRDIDNEHLDLNRALAREIKALNAFEDAKRRKLSISIRFELESKYMKAAREVKNINVEIDALKRKLAGNWAPESWGSADAS